MCAAGDAAAQDAVRSAELPEGDVQDLLAAAPDEPADRAAYLTLIGQHAQRQALDPDGSLLALAYRAATPRVRERLRALAAAAEDIGVVRVLVTGDQRDRIAEMTRDELDYLGRHLADHRQWDELRRLARDLPVAEALAALRLLPERERTGRSPEEFRATVERLPRDRLITYEVRHSIDLRASFSPDTSELALHYESLKPMRPTRLHVEAIRVGTGEIVHSFSQVEKEYGGRSVLHLGDQIVVKRPEPEWSRIVRVVPDVVPLGPPDFYSELRRSSGGGVTLTSERLAFIDPGADALRYEPLSSGRTGTVATLPAARLIATFSLGHIGVWDEDGNVVHKIALPGWHVTERCHSALSFLSPDSLALNEFGYSHPEQSTEIGSSRRTGSLAEPSGTTARSGNTGLWRSGRGCRWTMRSPRGYSVRTRDTSTRTFLGCKRPRRRRRRSGNCSR
ncbi:hypothetical protein [Actinomadura sp. 9N215]|uniref:hypothetical protein n=1 Tax=Actinomadura sp. 9N215 TaxID=3375150 RepID=UPI0037A479B9